MAAPSHVPRPLRRAAVAAALLTGCVASIATQPAVQECAETESEVSSFYGPQSDDGGAFGLAEPNALTAHGYALEGVSVEVPGCVAEQTPVRVSVSLDFAQDGTGGAPEDVFASFEVMDATGRTWHEPEPGISEAQPATSDRSAQPASAHLAFDLPLDVQEPVVLLLGDLATEDLDRLVLDPTGTGEDE